MIKIHPAYTRRERAWFNEHIDPYDYPYNLWSDKVDNPVIFIVQDDTKYIGHAAIETQESKNGVYWYVSGVWIDKNYRNQGIGKALMTYVVNYIRQHSTLPIHLWTNTVNIPAVRVYEFVGFQVTYRIPEKHGELMYGFDENSIKMEYTQ